MNNSTKILSINLGLSISWHIIISPKNFNKKFRICLILNCMLTTTLKLYKIQLFTWYIGTLTNRKFLLIISLKIDKHKNIKSLSDF
jgi:hypothetical protein